MLDQDRYAAVYAPGTRQNHPNEPGCYRFYLACTWSTHLLPNGRYKLDVQAVDSSGNRATASLPFALDNRAGGDPRLQGGPSSAAPDAEIGPVRSSCEPCGAPPEGPRSRRAAAPARPGK